MKIALGLAYDGSPYQGWQTQPGGGAIQDHLQAALAAVSGHPVATICAGRTDAGVHATAQVVHFETMAERPLTAWVRGTNAHLPGEIAVQWARVVEPHFHARYSARARSYRYLILRSPVRQPLWRSQAAWVYRPLDLELMRAAATRLVGQHDFSAFRAAACQASTPVRQVYDLTIAERDAFWRSQSVPTRSCTIWSAIWWAPWSRWDLVSARRPGLTICSGCGIGASRPVRFRRAA